MIRALDVPTLPPVVAEVMQVHKTAGFETLLQSLDDIEQLKKNTSDSKYNEVVTWLVTDNNLEMYALAWILNIYKVKKSYIVQNNEGTILLIKYDGKVTEPKGHSVNDESFNYHLTEQEIKDFDPRYWEFADPVDVDV